MVAGVETSPATIEEEVTGDSSHDCPTPVHIAKHGRAVGSALDLRASKAAWPRKTGMDRSEGLGYLGALL